MPGIAYYLSTVCLLGLGISGGLSLPHFSTTSGMSWYSEFVSLVRRTGSLANMSTLTFLGSCGVIAQRRVWGPSSHRIFVYPSDRPRVSGVLLCCTILIFFQAPRQMAQYL